MWLLRMKIQPPMFCDLKNEWYGMFHAQVLWGCHSSIILTLDLLHSENQTLIRLLHPTISPF
jgi:hypothetical protein